MALYIICVFYELFLKWNSSWVFFNKSKSNTHFKVLCAINFIKETLWIAFKYFLQWCGKSFSVQLSSFKFGCQRFPAQGARPRRQTEDSCWSPWLSRMSLHGGTAVLAPKCCGTAAVLCSWHPRCLGAFGHSCRDRCLRGMWMLGGISCPLGSSWLPCPAWGAWHGPVQCNIPKAAQCQCWQFCHTVPGSALGTVCGVMGQMSMPSACPWPLCLEGELLGQLLRFVNALKWLIFSCCCFGFSSEIQPGLCAGGFWCWLGPCANMLLPFLCLILPSNWASFSFIK